MKKIVSQLKDFTKKLVLEFINQNDECISKWISEKFKRCDIDKFENYVNIIVKLEKEDTVLIIKGYFDIKKAAI